MEHSEAQADFANVLELRPTLATMVSPELWVWVQVLAVKLCLPQEQISEDKGG